MAEYLKYEITWLILWIAVAFSPINVHASFCDLEYDNSGKLHARCDHRNLHSVPSEIINPTEVISLDLSGNNIVTLRESAFTNYLNLIKLNLSAAGIQSLNVLSLDGLSHLEILDLTNNPFIGQDAGDINATFFKPCPRISHLYISGAKPLFGDVFTSLRNLQEITMTPLDTNMPIELSELPKLRVLNFAFCNFNGYLTRAMMHPFATSNIEELAFHVCAIHTIENGTFDDFKNLKLLNLAGNVYISVPDVLDILSNSLDLKLKTLVLDLVGTKLRQPVVLATRVNGSCRRLWDHVRYLSIRSISLVAVQHFQCFKNLITFSAGFNSPFASKPQITSRDLEIFKLRYLDMSYFFVEDRYVVRGLIGYKRVANWIAPNHSFLPARRPEWEINNCDQPTNVNYSVVIGNDCKLTSFPPCFLYLKLDHLSIIGEMKIGCEYILMNNMRYLNFSDKLHDSILLHTTQIKVMGFLKVEILDISGCGLYDFIPSHFDFCGTLQELYLSRNNMVNIAKFPDCKHLRIIDLSHNNIESIASNTWENVPNLTQLNLNNNYLQGVDWFLPCMRSLQWVGLVKNRIQYIRSEVLKIVDQCNKDELKIDLRGNPLQCGCDQLEFIIWSRKNTATLANKENLTCLKKSHRIELLGMNLKKLEWICSNTDHKIMLSCVSAGIGGIFVCFSLVLYKYRWSLKWKYYKMRYSKSRRPDILLDDMSSETLFSAFVIYPLDDDQIRAWVINNLMRKLEVEWQRAECFIRGRNDLPGAFDTDNIVNGLMHSQCALWVICPGFFEDTLCEMAAHFALRHFGVNRNVLLIMENRFDQYRIPKHLANLLSPKMVTLRLRYTEDDDGQNLFWSKLRDFVPI